MQLKKRPAGLPTLRAAGADRNLDDDAVAFSEALGDLIRSYRLRENEEVCSFGITLTECYGLEALVRQSPMTVNEFAAALGLDKSTASRAVFSLEQKGYADRRPHPGDGRALQLEATLRGSRLYRRICRSTLECHRCLLSELDAPTRRVLTQILRRLVRTSRPCAQPTRRSA